MPNMSLTVNNHTDNQHFTAIVIILTKGTYCKYMCFYLKSKIS